MKSFCQDRKHENERAELETEVKNTVLGRTHFAETSGPNKQHVPMSIREKSNIVREQPPRM